MTKLNTILYIKYIKTKCEHLIRLDLMEKKKLHDFRLRVNINPIDISLPKTAGQKINPNR